MNLGQKRMKLLHRVAGHQESDRQRAQTFRRQHQSTLILIVGVSLLLAACNKEPPAAPPSKANTTDPQWVEQATPHAKVAVVFVHGIFGDTLGTWTSANGTTFFQLLKKDPGVGPKVDVFAFGYTSSMIKSGSFDIREAANKLHESLEFKGVLQYPTVVFVAHSMGGLVVLQHLLMYRDLLEKVPLIVLYATPQEGAQIATIAEKVANNPALVQMFPADRNGYLQQLNDEWGLLPTRPRVVCSYEKIATGGVMVVPWSSATRFCDGAPSAIPANHIDIVKPDRADHESAVVLINAFNRYVGAPPGTASPAMRPAVAAAEYCVKVQYFSPNVIPHYLLNSVGSENFPYWLRIVAQNDCGEDRIMTLRFESSNDVGLENPPQLLPFTVHKGDKADRTFNPRLESMDRPPDSVKIAWSIEDEQHTKISADYIQTEIVPPLTIAWDLQKPVAPGKRVPVEREFLLGSLKAWILKSPPKIEDLGRACRTTPTSKVMLEREEAIRACYLRLFTGNRALVSETPISFPAGNRQRIRRPVDLIEDRLNKASSLEAALLLTAVVESKHKDDIDPDLVLIIAPVEGAVELNRKTAFIAWREAGGPWRAVELRVANAQPFDANVAAASAKVAAIVGDNAEIADAIDNKGAGFSKDGRFAALNFARVPPEYRIRGLP